VQKVSRNQIALILVTEENREGAEQKTRDASKFISSLKIKLLQVVRETYKLLKKGFLKQPV
jgi:hypothetical protein